MYFTQNISSIRILTLPCHGMSLRKIYAKYDVFTKITLKQLNRKALLLSYQPRVTVASFFVYKVIMGSELIDHLCINPVLWIGFFSQVNYQFVSIKRELIKYMYYCQVKCTRKCLT